MTRGIPIYGNLQTRNHEHLLSMGSFPIATIAEKGSGNGYGTGQC